jgi:hypothetical protein
MVAFIGQIQFALAQNKENSWCTDLQISNIVDNSTYQLQQFDLQSGLCTPLSSWSLYLQSNVFKFSSTHEGVWPFEGINSLIGTQYSYLYHLWWFKIQTGIWFSQEQIEPLPNITLARAIPLSKIKITPSISIGRNMAAATALAQSLTTLKEEIQLSLNGETPNLLLNITPTIARILSTDLTDRTKNPNLASSSENILWSVSAYTLQKSGHLRLGIAASYSEASQNYNHATTNLIDPIYTWIPFHVPVQKTYSSILVHAHTASEPAAPEFMHFNLKLAIPIYASELRQFESSQVRYNGTGAWVANSEFVIPGSYLNWALSADINAYPWVNNEIFSKDCYWSYGVAIKVYKK